MRFENAYNAYSSIRFIVCENDYLLSMTSRKCTQRQSGSFGVKRKKWEHSAVFNNIFRCKPVTHILNFKSCLPENRELAFGRLKSLVNKMKRNPELVDKYDAVIEN